MDKLVTNSNFDPNDFNVTKNQGSYLINDKIVEVQGLSEVINSITEDDCDKFTIENGELKIFEDVSAKEIEWANDLGIKTKYFSLIANIKKIKSSKIVVELLLPFSQTISYVNIKNSLNNTVVKNENINEKKAIIEFNTQIDLVNDITIYTGEKYYFAKFKINSTRIGGENSTIKGLADGYYAYGANGKYYYKQLSGDQIFSNSIWGDPCPGIGKSAYSVGNTVTVYDAHLDKSNLDFLKENTVSTMSINNYENGIFNISFTGYGMDMIKNITLYNDEGILSTGTINDNKFSISGQFINGQTHVLEIIYVGDSTYRKEIKLEKDESVEETLMGGEAIRIDTKGKWYYIKFGANTSWKYKWIYGSNVEVSNSTMGGDPAPGIHKSTYLVDSAQFVEKITME